MRIGTQHVTPFFLVPVTSSPAGLLLLTETVFTLLQNHHLIAICLHIMLFLLN